jgi:hypothetical protein
MSTTAYLLIIKFVINMSFLVMSMICLSASKVCFTTKMLPFTVDVLLFMHAICSSNQLVGLWSSCLVKNTVYDSLSFIVLLGTERKVFH